MVFRYDHFAKMSYILGAVKHTMLSTAKYF